MLEIKMKIEADALVAAINRLAGALEVNTSSAVGMIKREASGMLTIEPEDTPVPVKEEPAKAAEAPAEPKKEPEVQVADKDRYFYRSESDSYWMLKKGEVIPVQDIEQSSEVTKEEYDKWMSTPQAEAPQALEPISYADLFAKCQKLIQSKKMQVNEFSAMLQEFGVNALPSLTDEQRAIFNSKLPKEV